MECMKEGAKCSLCDSNKDLYASECTHIDPVCLTCATNMAKSKSTCDKCGYVLRKVIRRYELKACPAKEPVKFIAKFPMKTNMPEKKGGGSGNAKSSAESKFFRKSDKRKWSMHRETVAKSKMQGDKPWILEHAVHKEARYMGKKRSDPKGYYMVLFDGKRMNEGFVVYPIKYWYDFQKNIHYDTLTLEEAENQMKARKKNQEGFARWIMKDKQDKTERGVKTRLAVGEEDDDERDVEWDDMLDNEGSNKKKMNKDEDSVEEDEDEEKCHPNDDVDEDQDKDKGEEWEHEKEYADDDEQLQDNSPNNLKESESNEAVPDDISDFEDDEGITEAGKQIKMLLKKNFDENDVFGKETALELSANHKQMNENDSEDKDEKMPDAQIRELPVKNPTTERKERKRKVVDVGSHKIESIAMKKSKPPFDWENICVEFLQSGPKNVHEMHSFLKEQKEKGAGKDELKSIMKRKAQQRNGNFTLKKQ